MINSNKNNLLAAGPIIRASKAETTTCLVTACTKLPEEGDGAGYKLEAMHPSSLPYNERCFEPHDRVLCWERMHMWVQGEWMGVTSIVGLVRSRDCLWAWRLYVHVNISLFFTSFPPHLSPSSPPSLPPSLVTITSQILTVLPLAWLPPTGRTPRNLTVSCANLWSNQLIKKVSC